MCRNHKPRGKCDGKNTTVHSLLRRQACRSVGNVARRSQAESGEALQHPRPQANNSGAETAHIERPSSTINRLT